MRSADTLSKTGHGPPLELLFFTPTTWQLPRPVFCFACDFSGVARLVAALRARVLPKSGLGQACSYLLGHLAPLTAHLGDSHSRLDTHSVENAIRPCKLGAKNWLFIGHPNPGDCAAVVYSLVMSCQRRGHDPHDYLRDVHGCLPAVITDGEPATPAAIADETADHARIVAPLFTGCPPTEVCRHNVPAVLSV